MFRINKGTLHGERRKKTKQKKHTLWSLGNVLKGETVPDCKYGDQDSWNPCSPLEDEVEPITDHSHPDEPDPNSLPQMEPDGKEDKESGLKVSNCRDEEEPVLEIHEVLLEVDGGLDPCSMQEVHGEILQRN